MFSFYMSKRKTAEITQKRCHSFLGNVLDILFYKTFSKNQNTTISCFEEPLEQCLKSICPRENHQNHSKMAEKRCHSFLGDVLDTSPPKEGSIGGLRPPVPKNIQERDPIKMISKPSK
jgi:hypothetical protein